MIFLGIILCPIIIYAAKGLKLLSARKTDILIGAFIVAVSVSFLLLLAYLVFSAGLVPSIPKSSKRHPNMDASDDLVFRFVAAGIWIWICGMMIFAGLELIRGKPIRNRFKTNESESASSVQTQLDEVNKVYKPADQSVPWWLVLGVLVFMMYSCVQGFSKAGV